MIYTAARLPLYPWTAGYKTEGRGIWAADRELCFRQKPKLIRGWFFKETVVLRRWESLAGNLALTSELKTQIDHCKEF